MIKAKRTKIKIKRNIKRVLPLLLKLNEKRNADIISNILSLNEELVEKTLKNVFTKFENRHIDFKSILLDNYKTSTKKVKLPKNLTQKRKLLIGAYFTKEYSIESAALFNPSIVIHPDQRKIKNDALRFIMSLRATGEGHISSVVFRTGLISKDGEIFIDKPENKSVAAKKSDNLIYKKKFISERLQFEKNVNLEILKYLPKEFTVKAVNKIIKNIEKKNLFNLKDSKKVLENIFDTNYQVAFDKNISLNSKVLFPSSKAESNGMEDIRFVKFSDNNEHKYIGTYTAYSGITIQVQLIETYDFKEFKISSLYGNASRDKGMALFPEKINGKYAMIGRQEGDSITMMYSDNLYFWNEYTVIQRPERNWELTQLGNSSSPIKTPYGWLLLTHAVGPMREYVLSASLLDLNHPEKVLATLDKPLLSPNSREREGYVPNVVYTCGFIKHYDNLIIPYAMSDSATSFATVDINKLLKQLRKNIS